MRSTAGLACGSQERTLATRRSTFANSAKGIWGLGSGLVGAGAAAGAGTGSAMRFLFLLVWRGPSDLKQQPLRVLEALLDADQELDGLGAVADPVVVAQ